MVGIEQIGLALEVAGGHGVNDRAERLRMMGCGGWTFIELLLVLIWWILAFGILLLLWCIAPRDWR